jgi:hypothetical protein
VQHCIIVLVGGIAMGMLDWFRKPKSNVEVLDDVIWLTKQAKFAGIATAVARCLDGPEPSGAVYLVAHFPNCRDELAAIAAKESFDQRIVVITLADDLAGSRPSVVSGDSPAVTIIVAERHPLEAHDAAVVEFAEGLPRRCRLVHHVSLEDPLMKVFASPWVQNMLEQLGMDENEAIESRMVSRRIQEAARKVERQAVSDLRANSAEEWLQLNCPELWRKTQE